MNLLSRLQLCFINLRFILGIMCMWLVCVLSIVIDMNVVRKSDFFSIGPNESLMFFHSHINTWARYNMLVCLIVFHTLITDFISDALNPQLLNVVQNRSQKYIPHSKLMYYVITNVWATYISVSSLISIYIALSQCDIMLIRLFADICANMCTMYLYMEGKVYDLQRYNQSLLQENNNHVNNSSKFDEEMQQDDIAQINLRRQQINSSASNDELHEPDNIDRRQQLQWERHYAAKEFLLASPADGV